CKFDKHSHEKKVRVFSLENIHCSSSNQCPHDHSHNIIENKDPNRHKFKLNFFEIFMGRINRPMIKSFLSVSNDSFS
ncbi:MAG: hypothetical protein ACKPKO_13240, partial [Candidatus Fonsibacter sp.]